MGTYDDLLQIPRHLAALERYGEIVSIAEQAVRHTAGHPGHHGVPGRDQPAHPPGLPRMGRLSPISKYQALLNAGNLPAATRQLQAIHQQVQARAAADPTNIDEQGALAGTHSRLGDAATAAGDLTAARAHYQAGLVISPASPPPTPPTPEWQPDLSDVQQKMAEHEDPTRKARRTGMTAQRRQSPDHGVSRSPGRHELADRRGEKNST